MPQVTLEYSANINDFNAQELFSKLHTILGKIANIEGCKSRAIRHDDFYIGHGREENALIYLRIGLITGREESVKEDIGQQCYDCLTEFFAPIIKDNGLNCEPSVEVAELGLYFK